MPGDPEDFSGNGETVLIAEDEAGVREVARRILAANGYKVLVASGAEEALALAAGHRGKVDVALTDLAMPRMSGVELAGRLRKLKPGLKVVYMSGYAAFVLDRQGTIDAPLLEKPFKANDLLLRVREACDGPRQQP